VYARVVEDGMISTALQSALDAESNQAASGPLRTEDMTKRAAKPAERQLGSEPFYRPSRAGRRFVGGQFEPDVAKQLRLLAVEDDTTVQALLEEALDLLFAKKGRGSLKSWKKKATV